MNKKRFSQNNQKLLGQILHFTTPELCLYNSTEIRLS